MKRAIQKKILAAFLSSLTLCIAMPVSAAAPTVQMEKTQIHAGEKPVVNYTGTSGKDWVGVFVKGETPKAGGNILWIYTSKSGQPNGTTDFSNEAEGRDPTKLAVGEYDVYLLQNDGFTVLAKTSFTVISASVDAPKSLRYDRAKKDGYADGTVTITPPDNAVGLTGYLLYWANADGKLADYTAMSVTADGSSPVTYTMRENSFIPSGATRLIAYSVGGSVVSDTPAAVDLSPGDALTERTPLYSFEVFSDLHLTTQTGDTSAVNFGKALQDIKTMDADSIGLFNVGDITCNGKQEEYNVYKTIWEANSKGLPAIYNVIGNHDLDIKTADWNTLMTRFQENTGAPGPYYSTTIGDAAFLILGSQSSYDVDVKPTGNYADLHDDQMAWLREQLETAAKGSRPIFVFLHQPLKDTTSGTIDGQVWYGVVQDSELRALLNQYPQVVLFTGHTHWELDAKQGMYYGGGTGATFVNTAGVGALWTDSNKLKAGSQGLYVEVYTDRILIRGRDFISKQWVSSAQYMLDRTDNFETLTNAIPTEKEGLIAQKDSVNRLLADIQAMPAESQKTLADTKEKLSGLKSRIDLLLDQADGVARQIADLPQPEKVTFSDKARILDAQTAFEQLTKEQQALLAAQSKVLAAAVSALSNLKTDQTTAPASAGTTGESGEGINSPQTGLLSLLLPLMTLLLTAGGAALLAFFHEKKRKPGMER